MNLYRVFSNDYATLSGTGFETPSQILLVPLFLNTTETLRTGQHAPSGPS